MFEFLTKYYMVLENKKKICVKVTDSIVYACLDIDLGKVLFHYVMFCDKDLSSKSYRVSLRIAGLLYIFLPFRVPVYEKVHKTAFEIEEDTKLQIARKLPLEPLFFSAFKLSAGKFS